MSLLTLLQTQGASGAYTLVADGGTYSYSGNNANLTYTPVGSYTLSADGGSYTYSGNNANLRYNRILVADGGTYSYSGNNANLTYAPGGAYTLTAEGGVYSYAGDNANLVYSGQQVSRPSGGGDSTHWRSPPRKARKRRKGDKDQLSENVIADAAIELPAAPDRPLPAAIAALLDVVAPQPKPEPGAEPEPVRRAAPWRAGRKGAVATKAAAPAAARLPAIEIEDPAIEAERQRREKLRQIALADDEWLMTVI